MSLVLDVVTKDKALLMPNLNSAFLKERSDVVEVIEVGLMDILKDGDVVEVYQTYSTQNP